MSYTYFTIPYITSLETEEGWKQDPDHEYTYSIARGHYALREHQLNETTKKGEVVSPVTPLKGVTTKKIESIEFEVTTIKMEESIKEALFEEEAISEIVSSLSSGIGSEKIGKISSEVKSSIKTQLKESFKNSFTMQSSQTIRQKRVKTWEFTIDPEKFEADTILSAVKAYKKYALDLYLVFFDFLFVEYRRPPYGVRLKRNKIPEATGKIHPNIIKLDLPLKRIIFWKQLPDSLLLVNEKNYTIEVDDPFEIGTEELNTNKTFPVKLPPKPSLYELSEKTFPSKRWI